MPHSMEPVVLDQPTALERGRAHGEIWRREIHELAALRLELCLRRGAFDDAEDVLNLAGLHLPVLETEAPALFDELRGISDGANLSLQHLVVLDHYPALAEIPRPARRPPPDVDPGGCTAIYTVGRDGPLLGQTWDMHATAEPFVRMLHIRPRNERPSLVLTLTGCLGLAGVGAGGVAVTANDLCATDGRVGLLWTALVRQLIDADSAETALDRVRAAPRSGGRHFMIADGRSFFGIECSGQLAVLTQTGPKAAHLHTNHYFDPVLRRSESVPGHSTTFARLNAASTLYAQQRPASLDELWALLGSHDGYPDSICCHVDDPRADPGATQTCARLVMCPGKGQLRVARGCSRHDEPVDASITVIEGR